MMTRKKRTKVAEKKKKSKSVQSLTLKGVKITKGDIVQLSFVPLAELEMGLYGSPKYLSIDETYDDIFSLAQHFSYYTSGCSCEVIDILEEDGAGRIYVGPIEDEFDAFWIHVPVIKSAKVIDRIREIKVSSLDSALKFTKNHVEAGCERITRGDAEKIFKAMADWLDYELTE